MYSEQDIRNKATAHEAAAAWWANVLTDPKMDNGDQSETGAVATAAALLKQKKASSSSNISEDQLEVFELELARQLTAMIPPDNHHYIHLDVDYGPDSLLADCASTAGIHTARLGTWPLKTNMWIWLRRVEVSYGYRAPIRVVWQKEPVQ